MNYQTFFAWLAFGYLMLLGIRYLLGARVYLMCALREAGIRAATSEELDPEELQLISLFDQESGCRRVSPSRLNGRAAPPAATDARIACVNAVADAYGPPATIANLGLGHRA
jgi:hypothetical protein